MKDLRPSSRKGGKDEASMPPRAPLAVAYINSLEKSMRQLVIATPRDPVHVEICAYSVSLAYEQAHSRTD